MTIAYDKESYKELVEHETPETRAFEYALDLSYAIFCEMESQGLTRRQLAKKMGVSSARVSQLLNLQPNLTLKTIAKFELALGVKLIEIPHTLSSSKELQYTKQVLEQCEDSTVDTTTVEEPLTPSNINVA